MPPEQPERLGVKDAGGTELWSRAPVVHQRWGDGVVRGNHTGTTVGVYFYLTSSVEIVESSTVTVRDC